jgi:release factor glutamine methyltransferase
VFADDEARLLFESADTPAALRDMVARRVAGLPLEHIVGWAEFCGLRVAVDIEPAAVRCARRNLAPLGGRVYEGDLYAPLPDELRGRVDVLVANVPYVPTEAMGLMPREARVHEPRVTLDGGRDGLDVVRRVAAAAGDWLAPGGHVLMEIGEDQADAAVRALTAAGLEAAVANDDELHAWIVIGQHGRANERRH